MIESTTVRTEGWEKDGDVHFGEGVWKESFIDGRKEHQI